jgi:hypothetical protein
MKIVTKSLATDLFLEVLRLTVEVSEGDSSIDCNYFMRLTKEEKPNAKELETWIFAREVQSEQIFNGKFKGKSVVGAITPVETPIATKEAVNPATPTVPPTGPKGIQPSPRPVPPPPPPMPVAVPKPIAAPIAPPVQAPAPVAAAKPIGTLFQRISPDHCNQVKNLTMEHFPDYKDTPVFARIKLLMPLLDNKVVIYGADGKTMVPSFKEGVYNFLSGTSETF